MKTIELFTDGATPNNHMTGKRKGGVGVFFGEGDTRNISFGLKETKDLKVTNNVCELLGCLKGLETLVSTQIIDNHKIIIYSDSMYVINTITSWATKWEKNGWKKSTGGVILNLELVKQLYYLSKNLNVNYIHVNSHTKEPSKDSKEYNLWYGNFMADKLASAAAK